MIDLFLLGYVPPKGLEEYPRSCLIAKPVQFNLRFPLRRYLTQKTQIFMRKYAYLLYFSKIQLALRTYWSLSDGFLNTRYIGPFSTVGWMGIS